MKKSIGLNVPQPKEKCKDSRCAWHGTISLRGRVFRGVVRSAKSYSTAIIEWPYSKHLQKYERYERKTGRITVHNPPCISAKEGESVIAVECRPISKTKSFVIVAKLEPSSGKQGK